MDISKIQNQNVNACLPEQPDWKKYYLDIIKRQISHLQESYDRIFEPSDYTFAYSYTLKLSKELRKLIGLAVKIELLEKSNSINATELMQAFVDYIDGQQEEQS